MATRIGRQLTTVATLLAFLFLLAVPTQALAGGIVVDTDPPSIPEPPPAPTANRSAIIDLVRTELNRDVRERRSDNVPRYHFGRGSIAPYSIGDQWCVAFGTWSWSKAGFSDYLGTSLLRRSYGGRSVAIQVRDLTRWAKRTGHWTLRATPGDLVAYGEGHIGVVVKADRTGRAVRSIEGHQAVGVRWVVIEMSEVTGYISPSVITRSQRVARSSPLADVD
ncbi:MAG: hypothetical protein ACKOBH_00585 [bacterium]